MQRWISFAHLENLCVLKQLSQKLLNEKKSQKICEKSLLFVYANVNFERNDEETYLTRKNPKIIIKCFGEADKMKKLSICNLKKKI